MATKVDQLSVSFGADFRELLAEMRKAEAASGKFRGQVTKELSAANKAFDKFGSVARAAVLGFVSAFSTAKLGSAIRSTLEWADNTGTLAERLGVTTDVLQELLFAGRELNVTSEEMAKGLTSFWAKVSEAATGKGESLPVLKQLGIDPKSLRDADHALSVIGAKLREFDKHGQLSAAKALFGDEKAAQFLALMIGDLDTLKQKARELGVVIDADLIAKGTALNKEFEKVADVGIAKMRKEILGIVVDVQTLVTSIGNLGPEFDKLAEGLKKSFLFLPALQEIFRARDAARADVARIEAEQKAAAEFYMAPPETKAGPRKLNLDTASANAAASAMEGFEKQIEKARIAGAALRREFTFGKAAAETYKAIDTFANAAGKFKPTTEQIRQFKAALKEIESGKTALAFQAIAVENERLSQIIAAEVVGNRELVAVLEERFRLEDRLGRALTEAELARAEALAKTRFQIEKIRERSAAALQHLESMFDSFAGHAGQALDSILDKSKTVGEAMRDFFVSVLRDIANEFIKLGAINPLKNLLFGNDPSRQTLGGLFGSLFGSAIGGAATGGFEIGGISGFASGGRPSVGMPSLVGERGPELFVPDVAGTIVPNGRYGGTVTLVGSDSAMIAISELKVGLRSLGMEVRQVNGSIETRAVNAVEDDRRRR